jgi:hypothetical protein
MRSKIIYPLILTTICTYGCRKSVEQPVDIEVERAAITELTQKLFVEFWNYKSYEGWAKTFVHKPYSFLAWANKTEYVEQIGWEEIGKYWKKWLEENPEPAQIEHLFENYRIKIWRNVAIVSFDYLRKRDKKDNPDFEPWGMHGVLEKTGEVWKFISLIQIGRNSWSEIESE